MLLCGLGASLSFQLHAAIVSEDVACSAASGFLARTKVGPLLLPGREVLSVESRNNLWIARLSPSGHIILAGSDKCDPVLFFSSKDFVEPEAGSPFAAKLAADSLMVAGKEADESAEANATWAKLTATAAKRARLLAAAPSGTSGVVGPLMNCGWGQSAPFNDLSPLSSLCGCMATAAGQEHRYWRWPYRYEKSRQTTHGLRNSLNEYSDHVMRVDGRVPFNYDKIVAYAPNPSSTPWATDKEATYQTAWLSLWMQSLTQMGYKPGASGGTQKLCNSAENYWFEAGPVMSYWRDGYTNLWNAIKADLDFGSPIQVNSPGHQMVVDGYAIENEGEANEVDYININYGWGSPEGWVNLLTAVTESTSGGKLADFQTGYRPQKIVQFEPVPKVSTSNVTLKWHLPPCYTNRTTGFTIEIAKAGGATTSDTVSTHEETTTYTANGLDVGGSYTFTVTPIMSDGSEARSNIAVTTIGTPKAAPEIVSVSSIACGIDLVQQGFYIECGRGVTNTIDVACSTSVTSLDAYSSHLTVLPDNKVSTVNNGNGSWTINVDATSMAKDWDGDMLILTLVAANDDGTEAYKNLMLRFNSMRQELGGTYDIVETAANNAVWFCGTTTLDAKGQNVTFGAGAFCGTGTITLADTVGGGSFTFQGLGNFTGTLKWAPSVTVNLPADMSNFRGTLYFNSSAEDYTLSSDLPSTAKIFIAGNTQLTPGNVTIDAAVSGGGVINITGVNATFNNLTDFTGSISLGTFESAGTLTLKAGEERNVEIWNGTLYLTLDKAQVAYGYTTSQIKDLESFFGAKLVFQDENGKTLETWTSSLSEYTLESSANTWFPDVSSGTGNFWDEDRWSQGLPSAGDYVIFNDNIGESEMTLNLPSDFNLGYVKVVGTKFNIEAAAGTSRLSVDTLENEIPTKLSTTQFEPEVVIPRDKLFVSPGFTISCDIDHSLAGNLRDISDVFSALTYGNEYGDKYCVWRGTVVFSDYVSAGLDLREWGHSNSIVRLNGVTGYLKANTEFPYPVELVDNGETSALNWSNGSSGGQSTFDILTGTGTFQTTAGGGNTEKVLIKDISGFTGSFNLAAKNVAIADAMPEDATASNGRLYVEKGVGISAGKGWSANGGLYLGTNANLTVSGAFATGSAINTYGEGAVLTLEDGGSVKVNGAIAGDDAPTLNFKAGTYQITRNLTETKTVNFCAAAGKYTTLDANGNTFTLGAKFFSGSGDVYLKTTTSGGAFVIQGISSDYTGTIYVDNSIGLTISGDLSQMGGKINISDVTLSRDSSNIGKIDVCSGATLQVVLTDDEAMEGLTVTGVTLSGGTIEFVDQRGTVVGSSAESLVYVKPEDYTVPSPEATAIWYGDFSSDALTKFSGYTIDDWNETHGENFSSVTIDRNNQGLLVDFASAKGYFTVIVKYSDLEASSSYKRVLFATTATSTNYFDRCGIRLLTDSKVQGLWNASLVANNDDDYNPVSTGTVPSAGTLAFVYDKSASGGVSVYVAANDDSLPATALWNNTALKAGDMYGFAVGGMCRGAVVSAVEAAKGMTITGLAIFDRVLTTSELKYFRWPEESSGDDPEPEPTFEVSPASGAVAAGTKMTVTCDDPTATIWYKKLEDAEYSVYTEPVALETGINYYYVKVNDGEATLYTYIVAAPEPEPDPEPEYEGPAPIAVWVAGEFGDDKSAHGGLEFALNENTTNALGQIVIGSSTTLGATVAVPSGTLPRMTMLVKCSVPAGGAPVAQSVPASLFSTYDMGARVAQSGSSSLDGYWLNGSSITTGYAFSSPAQTMPQEGYVLISNWTTTPNSGDHGTAVYSGETLSTLVGGEKTGLRFTGADKEITAVGVGGPTVAGAKPWAGMVIKSVALFDEWVSTNVIANYKFPVQGAVKPEDSDRYVVEPVASWVNDFKTTTKGDYSLSVSGTTAAKDDTFGGTLTVGDAAAIIDTTAANSTKMTVLIKYRAASNVTNAPVVAFGGMAAVGLDVGVYTKSDKTLAVYRNFSADNGKPYNFGTAPQLSATGGYVLCARDNGQQCMAYVGDSLDAMTGGTVSDGGIKFSNITLTKLGIGGNSGMAANANDMVPFAGLEIEKIVVFNGYYTPDQIRYIPNPEDSDTVNIADNTTWTFTASDTPREYLNVGTLSSSGTIAIANASDLTEGTYPLATWTTPQQYTTQCAGYGKVGTLVTEGLAEGLSARLVYGARGIYLRVDDAAKQAARKPLVVWCYGDSITEGYNGQATGANYRILLYQKLEMLGYNVRSTGVYGLSNGYNSVDPTGTPLTDQYKWHSAKHGATAGPTTLAHRSNLSENVDTLAIQAGTPDVALLLIGVNDIPEWKNEADRVTPVFKAWTNVVSRMVKNLPDTKIVVSTILYSDGTRTDIDPTITAVNTQIKNLIDNLPAEWQGHVVLADLNSYVKSGETGIIYNDHLHPDWWGYDQMADGYLDAIVKCYPDPDATDFPSQNPIPAAPTSDQLGAANKPELAAYRAGFTKLCNIRVEKGQDVSNVVYDDVNGDAASDNLEKVGYFVEFVRADNHAHKWVWVDMDAFGDCDLASVGLPATNYQQAVTKMHVCSNHGAIDNVAADDDSVTGWIEFSPYDYTRTASNSAAPANYGEPFDWNDTLSESGSYGCMQVFRVMNPSSRELYERPQLMFAFNNFQSQNSNPADFGIGNFAQHFNCNNSYHTEDWTGVGGTLAKMAPDQYSVKTIEIWTKEAAYSGPKPDAVWVAGEFNDDKRVHGGCEFTLNGNTTNEYGQIVIGNSTSLGATIAVPNYDNATMLVKYEIPSGGAPAANSVPASVFVTKEMGALAGSGSSALDGYYLNGSTVTTGYAFSSPAPSIPQEGYLLIAVPANSNKNSGNHYTAAYVGETVSALSGGETSGLRFTGDNNRVTSIGVGGPTVAGAVPWEGMVIKSVALFDSWVTPDDIRGYKFPKHGAIQPEDADNLMIVDGMTWNFAAGTTRTYTNVGTLSTGGAIAITNAATLAAGTYTLATWTTAQKKSTGYGHVGTLDTTGLPAGLSAELVYGARAIYLRVWNPTTQAEKGTIKVWPYGDSITEGFNAGGTRANYRVLLAQKLSMLGYNVEMVGCYDKINNAEGIDPSGQVIPDAWKWHSAKHGATAGPTTSAAGRANLCENVDTLCAQAGNPDVVLLHAGANDIVPATHLTATQVVASVTNIVAHIATNLPDTKIVVGNQIDVEQGYNSGNYNHVTNMIPQVNALLKDYTDALPEELVGKVFLADLNSYVKSGEYGILFDHGSDHLHPDWWGHDQMAEGWLSVVTNQFSSTQTFPSATVPAAPTTEELGAAAKSELADYRQGFKLARRIDAASNLDTSNPYAATGDGATENIEKIAYFVEYVRADNNAHKWVWVDMDAFGTAIGDVGLPTNNHQQVVTKLHVKSNHNGIENVAADDDTVTGFVEFSPYDYNGNASGVTGAPAGNGSCCDWNDTLSESGSYSCMQVHRVFSPAKAAADGITRGGQVLFAYNNWQSSSSTAEFGIGNFSSHFYRGASDAQTLDYTYTANAPKMNADAYSVKRIEIWTKASGGDEPEEKTISTDGGVYPVPFSWIEACFPGIEGQPDAMYDTVAKSAGINGYPYWESYVLGLEPTNETSKFTVSIRMEGTTPIIEYTPTNEVLKSSGAIEYILQGKPTLTNGWQNVSFESPGDTNRFFRVKVEY